MYLRTLMSIAAIAAVTVPASAQTIQRRAVFSQRGNSDQGKCTIEVVVDIAVEIEIRGDNGTLRNFGGQPAQWRRFECTGPMPPNPADFRFAGVDGRGRQQLLRDPRNNGGVAVVRIEDKDGGTEGYTFDLFWNNGGGYAGGPNRDRGDDRDRGPGRRFTVDQAVRVCQDAVAQQAADRFRTRNITFRRTELDDNPGRRDWVMGAFDIRRGPREETYRFSCSVNFDTGQVRSAQIESPIGGPSSGTRAMESCQHAVEDRIRRDGYNRVEFRSINVDDRPGRNDWIVGNATAEDRYNRNERFDFSCAVDLRDGDVRSVDVSRR